MVTSDAAAPSGARAGTAAARQHRILRRTLRHLLLLVGAAVAIYPVAWLISASVKPADQIFSDPGLLAHPLRLDNYVRGWFAIPQASFATFFGNSLIVSGGSVLGNLISCSLAAYAFARLDFPLRRWWFAIMMETIMLPYHAVVVPQYIMFHYLGWVNTFLPLVVPKLLATDAFFIFLMVQFLRGLPRELDDAAKVDGCGPFGIFFRILLPLMKPALVTTAIFTFIWTWDDFFSHVIYLSDTSKYTVPLGLRLFLDTTSQSFYGPMFAMSVLSLVPVLIFFIFFQKLIVGGISTSGFR